MLASDTIVAIATPPGRSRLALIRISGPHALEALRAICEPPPASGAHRIRLALPAGSLPALAIRFDSPCSYTGQHTIELVIPGNPTLLERLVDAIAIHASVRRAEPGEFTARAFLSGRLTLTQAEGVAMAIAAESDAQLIAANILLAGETGREYERWADQIAGLLALTEAGVDFTDQEGVVAISAGRLRESLRAVESQMHDRLAAAPPVLAPGALPVVCIAGAPNAGKSTLFNALLCRARSMTSDQPGATRDVIEEPLDLSGLSPACPTVTLTDLAGIDVALAARSHVDGLAQKRAAEVITRADVVVVCDPSGRFDQPLPAPAGQATIRVRTKADLPGSQAATGGSLIPVCALDGFNLDQLRRAIADAALTAQGGASLTLLPRHADALRAALHEIAAANAEAGSSGAREYAPDRPEIVALHLRAALDHLGLLVGRIHPDDLLGRIFSTFCIGK